MAGLRLPPLPTTRDILKLYRLSAIKQLSQNFLLNERITDKIVKSAGDLKGADVLEVGPGPGAITRSIMKRHPKKLILVEKDERFKPTLEMLQEASSVINTDTNLIFDDIMNFSMANVFDDEHKKEWSDRCPNIRLIGNLPFSISTALIIKWLKDISEKKGAWSYGRVPMTLTFQKEVAERLVAEVSARDRCRLSTMAQAWTIPKLKFIIPGSSFVPKPDVDVGVVTFTPLKVPKTRHSFKIFEKINRHLFSYRQKYGKACAGTLFPPDCRDELSTKMYELAKIDVRRRSFNLSVEDIDRLISAYEYLCQSHPEIVNYNHRASRRILSANYTKLLTIQPYLENSCSM